MRMNDLSFASLELRPPERIAPPLLEGERLVKG